MPLGYDPRAGGLAILPDGTCWQGGLQVSCEDETPVYVAPPDPGDVPTGGPRCATGFEPRGNDCVPVTPPVETWTTCEAGYQYLPGRGCVQVPVIRPPVWKPPVIKPRRLPRDPPPSPIDWRKVWARRPRPLPRPVIRRPYVPLAPKPIVQPGQLCPVAGYVTRPIAGANEYQVFRCDPGRPVTIDAGLQAAGRAEALARRPGMSDLGFLVGDVDVPSWLPLVAIAVGVFAFMKLRR